MNNELVTKFLKKVDEHLPGLLVVAGIVGGIATVGYSVYAGWKIKEVAADDELKTKEKTKKIVLIAAPAVIGTAVSSACEICAHKEHTKRYAALGTLIAASKAEQLIGKEKIEEIGEKITGKKKDGGKPEKAHYPEGVDPGSVIRIHDNETGYEFSTTMVDFMARVNEFNTVNINGHYPTIADFYELLLGDNYDHCSAHEHIAFGVRFNDEIMPFAPSFEGGLTDDMKLIYRISYDYISK